MISIIDYGVGNTGSLISMCSKLGIATKLVSSAQDILVAKALLLPGVGHFDAGMQMLKQKNIVEPLKVAVLTQKKPILGICLGMQLFADCSEEGIEQGLGLISGSVKKFNFDPSLHIKIPNMGWLDLQKVKSCALFPNAPYAEDEQRFYFVHSYHYVCANEENLVASAYYGGLFTAVINKDNIWGTQFHPEKSHKHGMTLLKAYYKFAMQCR